MPVLNLPTYTVLTLNILGWPIIQLGFAWLFLRLPAEVFQFNFLFPAFTFELPFYERFFLIRRWKDTLPDGAAWFRGGFAKRRLERRDASYFRRFILESRRSECAHWAMFLAGGVFILWNPLWAIVVMLVYALLANIPCILAQRYNRLRLRAIYQLKVRRRDS